jgi:hypothetical protein
MKRKVLLLTLLFVPAALYAARPLAAAGAAIHSILAQEVYHFRDVTLTDGEQTFDGVEIVVRVRAAGGGYTRADYFDRDGRRLGFYEAFEKISSDEAALRAWAISNFPDRTPATR